MQQPEGWQPEDIDVLVHIFRTPTTVKSQFARDNIYEVMRLIENGLLTTFDPFEKQYSTTLHLTQRGSYIMWAMQGTVPRP